MDKLVAAVIATALTESTTLAEGVGAVTLDVANMSCNVCPHYGSQALEKVTGVASAKVDFCTKRAHWYLTNKGLVNALTKATAGRWLSVLCYGDAPMSAVVLNSTHHVPGVRTYERRDDAHRRVRMVLRVRALRNRPYAEGRRLLCVLLVWHPKVSTDAAARPCCTPSDGP